VRLAPAEAREAARSRGGLIVDIRSERQREGQGLVAGAASCRATCWSGEQTRAAPTTTRRWPSPAR
jgi:hypothetical protein